MAALGSGARFAALARKKGPRLAAWIGRQKYGAKGMAALSHKGTGGAAYAMAQARKRGRA